MKSAIAIAAISASLISSQARADEHRPGDAALGALSGAVVLGPIGAVAGAVVGYTAGPSIAHAWGFRRSSPTHQQRTRSAARQEAQSAQAQAPPAATTAATSPQPRRTAVASKTNLPPVQT